MSTMNKTPESKSAKRLYKDQQRLKNETYSPYIIIALINTRLYDNKIINYHGKVLISQNE